MNTASGFTSESRKAGKVLLRRALKYTGAIIGALILILLLLILFYPDPLINSFLKSKIEKTLADEYPQYSIKLGNMHYNIWKNRLSSDSIIVKAADSSFVCSLGSFSIGGISWIKVLREGGLNNYIISSMVLDAQKVLYKNSRLHNGVSIAAMHISIKDSSVTADSIKNYSLIKDERLFRENKFRQTRVNFDIPKAAINGLDYTALFSGNNYLARKIKMDNVFVDILVDMDKPYDLNSPNPQMPNELIHLFNGVIKIDSLKIGNGLLHYSERYSTAKPLAVVKFSKINISAARIGNSTNSPDTAIINGEGLLMNAGKMKVIAAIPLTSHTFSLKYSGTLGAMDAVVLNSFIVPAEHHRIKSGQIHSAKFYVNVKSGHATGALYVVFSDLNIAILDKDTESEKGIFNRIASLFGKIFIIRGNNLPDSKGKIKIGVIDFKREPSDYFTQYLWFALRGGVADIAGFPRQKKAGK